MEFNPSNVNTALTNLNNAYANIISNMNNTLNNNFIAPMSTCWASPIAVQFFNSVFLVTLQNLNTSIKTVITDLINVTNQAGQINANDTGMAYTQSSFTPQAINLNVGLIKNNFNGSAKIDPAQALAACNCLSSIVSNSESQLDSVLNFINANPTFVDNNGNKPMVAPITALKTSISNAMSAINTATKNAIQATVDASTSASTTSASALSDAAGRMNI